ncbi:hypothetical protein FACS189451_10990 [Bacteroidia bacterium]|nr:hypothetical protein FACS189446_1980 [Bacteroidia bacterium]GHT63835.1 hypothetical protein FACS189451_10990 [Bacteroidia bacterium]
MFSQNVLHSTLNHPRSGDRLVKEQVPYQKPDHPGMNRTWDFSFTESEPDYPVEYFSREDCPLISSENGILFMYRLSGDSLLLNGYETSGDLVHFREPALLLKYPAVYGSESQSSFLARGKHDDRMESVISGTIHTQADAYGTLILPGDTLENTVRIHIRRIETGYYQPLSTQFSFDEPVGETAFSDSSRRKDMITTDTWQWYEEGFRYPVFETVETCRTLEGKDYSLRKESYLYRPAGQAVLPADSANQALLNKKQAAKKKSLLGKESNILYFSCYPNPVHNLLEVQLSFRESSPVQLSLYSLSGKELYRSEGESTTGYHSTIDMSAYPAGTYLLRVLAGEASKTEKIIKQ